MEYRNVNSETIREGVRLVVRRGQPVCAPERGGTVVVRFISKTRDRMCVGGVGETGGGGDSSEISRNLHTPALDGLDANHTRTICQTESMAEGGINI